MNLEQVKKGKFGVPDYTAFLTVDELNHSTKTLNQKYPEEVVWSWYCVFLPGFFSKTFLNPVNCSRLPIFSHG